MPDLQSPATGQQQAETGASGPPPAAAWQAVVVDLTAGSPPLHVAGVELRERQSRLLRAAGAARITFADRALDPAAIAPDGDVLVVRCDRLIDPRLLARLAADRDAVLVDSDGAPVAQWARRDQAGDPFARADGEGVTLRAEDVDAYVNASRRQVPVRIVSVTTPAEAAEAERLILADAQRGVLDWPARFIHAPIENATVRLLWPTPITPNMVSLFGFVLGLAAMLAFALGHFWPGLVMALVVGAFDGVDGKLARTRLQVTPIGELEHLGDKIIEYGWYIALAIGLAPFGNPLLMAFAATVATLSMVADVALGGVTQKVLGRSIDDAGPFERRWRLVSGRRNTHMWALLAFGLFGAWQWGLVFIAVSAQLTVLVRAWRLFVRAGERPRPA